MKQTVAFVTGVLLAVWLPGCAIPQGTTAAVDAAHRAVVADEEILAVYHGAVMESFDQARRAHVETAKRIVERLDAEGALTAPVVQEGFDRLLANLDEVERRRDTFRELRRLARENNANAKEALRLASDLVERSSATQERLRDLLEDAVTAIGQPPPAPEPTPPAPAPTPPVTPGEEGEQ